jgi:hypothetical protein
MTTSIYSSYLSSSFFVALWAIGSLGCAKWSRLEHELAKSESHSLPKPMAEDVAVVETMLVRLSHDQVEGLQPIWSLTNEQALPIELRRRLDQNGLRATLVDTVVPSALQAMIDSIEKRLQDDPFEQMGIGADIHSHSRQLQCRIGQRKEILMGSKRTQSVVLMHNKDGAASGRSYDEPQFVFDLRASPQKNRTTLLSLTPEVQHGPFKQKFVPKEFGIRSETKRDAVQWTELTIEQSFRPGQILMVTSGVPSRGLGEQFFFTETVNGSKEQMLLMMRFTPHRMDSVFKN